MKIMSIASGIGGLALFLAACSGASSSGDPTPMSTSTSPAPTAGGAASVDAETVCAEPPDSGADEIPASKLYFEYNSADEDTGVHGLFDSSGFTQLCVYDPDGNLILAVSPQEQLKDLGMGGIFFESREPEESEVSQADVVTSFPEGDYKVTAITHDGKHLAGDATLSHAIPLGPEITSPAEGDIVNPESLVVSWEPVTETINGDPISITGYEVIVTNEEAEDPNGLAQPILSAHVTPSVTSLTIPSEFMEAGTEYELEVIAIEESGNQTISIVFFETP